MIRNSCGDTDGGFVTVTETLNGNFCHERVIVKQYKEVIGVSRLLVSLAGVTAAAHFAAVVNDSKLVGVVAGCSNSLDRHVTAARSRSGQTSFCTHY